MARLREKYKNEIAPALAKEFEIKNPMAIPKIEKIVVNMGLGEASANAKILDVATEELEVDHGPKAGHHQGEEIDRCIQAASGNGYRHDGHASRRPNV